MPARRCSRSPPPSPRPTGAAHWHVLLRARAIEARRFVVAAAQTGVHEDGRATYGHSLVVDPWGEVLLDMGEAPGLGFAEIDPARARRRARAHPGAAAPPRRSRAVDARYDRVRPANAARGHVFEAWFGSSARL